MVVWLRGPAHWLVVTAVTGVALGGCAVFEERPYQRHGSIKDDHAEMPRPARKRTLVSASTRRAGNSGKVVTAKPAAATADQEHVVVSRAAPSSPAPAAAVSAPSAASAPTVTATRAEIPAPEPKTTGSAVVMMPSVRVPTPPEAAPAVPQPPVSGPAKGPESAPVKLPEPQAEPMRQSMETTGSLPEPSPRQMARRAFDDGQKLFADGRVMDARRRFVSVLGAMPAEATLALARSFDHFYLARLQASDGVPDTLRALQLYGRAAEQGAVEARADLERIQDNLTPRSEKRPESVKPKD